MGASMTDQLTEKHVLLALADLDAGVSHPFGTPVSYELVHDGKRYPPKAVVGLAYKHLTGEMIGPQDFWGGEGPGKANDILRDLGFEVEEKGQPQAATFTGFVTSRPFPLPDNAAGMTEKLWFNMWERRLWPYKELKEGNTLYWYDTTEQAIVWKSRAAQVERFEYGTKDEVRKRFQLVFGEADLTDPYFDAATNQGYCLAYKVDSLVRLSVPKPADYRFPQGGWLRCSDEDASEWLKYLSPSSPRDGPSTDALSKTATQVAESGYFSPASLKDEREKKLREIVERRGQPDFRNKLIDAYGGRCAVTGCDAVAALEAAHIVPYTGPQSNHVTNGLLLRADIHTLFDLDLIGINPESMTISVAPHLSPTVYGDLQGQKLQLPANTAEWPNQEALAQRWQQFGGGDNSTAGELIFRPSG